MNSNYSRITVTVFVLSFGFLSLVTDFNRNHAKFRESTLRSIGLMRELAKQSSRNIGNGIANRDCSFFFRILWFRENMLGGYYENNRSC